MRWREGRGLIVLRCPRPQLERALVTPCAALDGGEQWEIDNARMLAARELNHIKDRP